MGRSRELADILGKTEVLNTNNEALLTDASAVDSAYVTANTTPALAFFNTLDSLPITSLTSGQQAYVSANNRLYISDGSGWYNKALITLSPTISMDPSGTITLASDGTTTSTVTVVAIDSDTPGSGLTYSVDSDGNGIGKYVISQDSSVFTVRPLSSDSGATEGTFALTFSATDGVNIATDSSSFSLTFQNVSGINFTPTDTINRLTSQSTNLNISQTGYQNGDTIPYTITGVTSGASGDITNPLTGNVTIGSTFTLQGSGVDATKSLGDKTGTMTVGGQSDTFEIEVKLAGRAGAGANVGAPFDSQKYIIVRDGLFAYTDTSTSNVITFGRFSSSTYAQLMQGFLLGRPHGQTNSGDNPSTGNAGNSAFRRDWRSIKIYGLINNVVTHTHTFSWARNCGEMYANYGSSSSNHYVTLGSFDSTTNYCTRDYTLASYNGVNINNIYFIEFHANASATSLINTSYWNGAGSLLV